MGHNALVVAISTETRMRLKEAVNLAQHFERVFVSNSLREARTIYVTEPTIDGIFVSNEFARPDIPSFIQKTKASQACQDAAYILVLDEKDSVAKNVTESMLAGIDGLLLAPFSVERIRGVVETVRSVSAERRAKRREGMLKFLVKNIKTQFSRTVKAQRGSNEKLQMQLRALKDLCHPLADFDNQTIALYYEQLITAFIDETPPPKQKGYRGASNRVRQMFEEWEKKNGPE
jgi:response regulator RpfG family c-di-GMP phosphodiesterase